MPLQETPKIFHNILVVRTDRIGDVVLTTPAIKALREQYSTARISVLIASATFDLVNGNPYVDEILVDDRQGAHQGLLGFWRLVKKLRAKRFDLAVVFHTKRRYNLACFMASIPFRLGYKNNKFGFLLTHPLKDTRHSGQKHEAQHCMDVLKAIGIENDSLEAFVPLQKEAEEWVSDWMKENNLHAYEYMVIHPGSSDPAKCWPTANFALLMERLVQKYPLKIVLIGSQATLPVADEIIKRAGKSACIDLTGKTSLAQTVSLLKRSRLLVSNDSGPVHVAAGLGTSVISLFLRDGPGINAGRWRPLGARGFVLIGAIKIEDVVELIDQIFQKDNQYEIF